MKARFFTLVLLLSFLWAPPRAGAQCADWLIGPFDNGTAANGANDFIGASTICDPDGNGPLQAGLVVGGTFTSIGGVAAQHVAYRNPATGQWQALGAGISANVYALTVWNNQIVAAGGGDSDPGSTDNNILRWDGSAWQTFYGGTSTGTVYALAVYNGQLFAGGSFVIFPSVSTPAQRIARWNEGAGRWQDVDSGADGTVQALYPWAGYLYVGGAFTTVGGASCPNGFARWNGAWQPLNGTTVRGITDFCPGYNGELLASGNFINGNGLSAPGAGSWNGGSWTVYPTTTANNSFYRIAAYNGSVYVGGFFTLINNVSFNHVARWSGSAWQSVDTGINGNVWQLDVYNNELLAMGTFNGAGSTTANNIARWNGFEWGAFGGGSTANVLAMTPFNGRLVAGGNFHQFTASGPTAHYVAGYTTSGTLTPFGTGMNGPVYALKSYVISIGTGSTDLVAGGNFSVAGGIACANIARWNESNAAFPPPAWIAMGAGLNGVVYAIERHNGATYAAGAFTLSGSTSVSRIARWNAAGGVWEPLSTGMNGAVYALKSFGGSLYAGGAFTTAGGASTGHLAKWSGTIWSVVGPPGGLMGDVYSLEVHGGLLVIGGGFPFSFSDGLCTWDGTSFGYIGSGVTNNGAVRALRSTGSRLYAGGDFTNLNGAVASRAAYWDGSAWHAMGGGTNNIVAALGYFNSEVHAGGYFTTVDGGTLTSPTWARYTETGVPPFGTHPSYVNIMPGMTATFNAIPSPGYPGYLIQWYHNGAPLSDGPTGHGSTIQGAHTTQLVITNTDFHTDYGSYWAVVTNGCGSAQSGVGTLSFEGFADVPSGSNLRTAFDAMGPNPSRGSAGIAYSLERDAAVRVRVHDVAGRLVRDMDLGRQSAGSHSTTWDARDTGGTHARPGIYFVRLDVDGQQVGMKRLAIMR